jgi:trk system potassium uptake protein TrkA
VQGVVGNGASIDIQVEAGMKNADVAIALTKSDELNVFACMVAKKLGVKNTVARVRNPDYRQQIIEMKNELGISMIVNPEQDTAMEIFNLINLPAIVEVERFANGKVLLVEVAVEQDCALVGKTLIEIGQKISPRVLICAIQRGEEVVIPSGRFKIQEGDKICFTANARELRDFLSEAHIIKSPLKNIMIIGGSRIAYYLANQLSQKRYNVKLLEKDMSTAEELADKLPKVTVVNGSGTQHDILLEEGIEAMDAFVALTDIDEENIITSMFANSTGVKKTITQIQNDDLYSMLTQLGIKNTVSAKDIVADRVTSYIRALANSRGSNVLTLYRLVNDRVEAMEFAAKTQEKLYGKPLRELKIKKDCLVACIIRHGQVIIPDGNTSIHLGDSVIVVTTHKNFDDLTDIFE